MSDIVLSWIIAIYVGILMISLTAMVWMMTLDIFLSDRAKWGLP